MSCFWGWFVHFFLLFSATVHATWSGVPEGRCASKEHARSWIDLDSDGAVTRDEWAYYRAAMASENGMLAIRMGGRGDVTASNVASDGSLQPLVVNDLQDDIYATPAIADGRIYVRTRGTLYCFGR